MRAATEKGQLELPAVAPFMVLEMVLPSLVCLTSSVFAVAITTVPAPNMSIGASLGPGENVCPLARFKGLQGHSVPRVLNRTIHTRG